MSISFDLRLYSLILMHIMFLFGFNFLFSREVSDLDSAQVLCVLFIHLNAFQSYIWNSFKFVVYLS